MERIHDIVKVNERSVSKSDNISKSDFQSGDTIVEQYRKSHFEGLVAFSWEQKTVMKCSKCAEKPEIASVSPSSLGTGMSAAADPVVESTGKARKRLWPASHLPIQVAVSSGKRRRPSGTYIAIPTAYACVLL